MKEKFEHKLIQKIKDVFDSNEPDFNPQDWENLKGKLEENLVRKAPVFWNTLKAASVLLIFVIGSYFIWQRLIHPVDPVTENEMENSIRNSKNNADDFQQTEKLDQNPDSLIISEHLPSKPISQQAETVAWKLIQDVPKADDLFPGIYKSPELATITDTIDTLLLEEREAMITQQSQIMTSENLKEPKDTVLPLFLYDPDPDITMTENKKQKQKMKVGVELATFTNYAPEELVPEMNFGAGLTANIPIKSRFSFAPGIIVSSYNMQVENTEQLSNKNTTTTQTSEINTIDALIESNPDIQPTGVELTGLDIPLNFQYCFIRKPKSDYFVELGFSSLFYLSEKYDYTVTEITGTNPDGTFEYGQTFTGETETPAFETFDFASLLNFSMGWDYRLSRGFGLTLNPYLKYPVSTMTSGDIKFGSGGIKLKFMIIPRK